MNPLAQFLSIAGPLPELTVHSGPADGRNRGSPTGQLGDVGDLLVAGLRKSSNERNRLGSVNGHVRLVA